MVCNPANPQALTPVVSVGAISDDNIHADLPLMGMTGRPRVVHFAGVTHWTFTGKQRNGVRLVQIHPDVAAKAGIVDGDEIVVESLRGSVKGTAQVWPRIRRDTVFVPNTFGPMQKMAEWIGVPKYQAANTLVDDRHFDNVSGQQAYKCFACRVKKA